MDIAQKVRHIVVLMLENRSFDHMVGFLKSANPAIDGVDGSEWNPKDPSVDPPVRVPITDNAGYMDLQIDPGHTTPDVTFQIYANSNPVLGPLGPNKGFVFNYLQQAGNTVSGARKIMRCFRPSRLPVLTTLAQEFALCDHWFSSVPGLSWPNRMFVHAATSDGHLDNKLHDYDIPSLYNHLEDAQLSWKIYFHDFPQALALKRVRDDLFKNRFRLFAEFLEDARKGRLAHYSFIEPRYYSYFFKQANDQHPTHDVSLGEVLIADVYEALRNSELWEESLLVILWDEHGGIYDHVFPPDEAVPNPDGKVSQNPPFDFQRLGIRVPAVLVSPYIPRNTVDHRPYDHASVPATVKKIFALPDFLTRRDAQANTFEMNLSLDQTRTTPPILDRPLPAGRIAERDHNLPFLMTASQIGEAKAGGQISNTPLTECQHSLIALATNLAASGTLGIASLSVPPTLPLIEHEGALYVRKIAAALLGIKYPSS